MLQEGTRGELGCCTRLRPGLLPNTSQRLLCRLFLSAALWLLLQKGKGGGRGLAVLLRVTLGGPCQNQRCRTSNNTSLSKPGATGHPVRCDSSTEGPSAVPPLSSCSSKPKPVVPVRCASGDATRPHKHWLCPWVAQEEPQLTALPVW